MKEFLCRAKQLKLSLHEVPIQNLGVYDASSIQRFGMTEKKAHEVMEMALYINNLITPLGICQVINSLKTKNGPISVNIKVVISTV